MLGPAAQWWGLVHAWQRLWHAELVWYLVVLFLLRIFKWMVWSLLIYRFCHCCHDSLWLVQGYDWVSNTLMWSDTCLAMLSRCRDGMISRDIIFITNIHLGLFGHCWCMDSVIAVMTHCGLCRGSPGPVAQWWSLAHAWQCWQDAGTVWYHVLLFLLRIFKWMVWSLLMHRFCHCCHDSLWLV